MARKSVQQIADEFEERIRKFLKDCGFKNVKGGPNFRIGRQIDACGGYEDTLLIVECKTRSRKGRSLLNEITDLRGKMRAIRKAARKHLIYGKYSDIRFCIASNFVARKTDKDEAGEGPAVYLWDVTFVTYYEDLLKKIGDLTLFNLLGEIGAKPRVESRIHIPCFMAKIGKLKLYIFFEDPEEILKWAYVARREIGRETYYQRWIQVRRLQNISEFVDKGGYFPNAPIIGFNVKPTFHPIPEVKQDVPGWARGLHFGCISFPKTYRSCWIIDGQHRLYGLVKSRRKKQLMPFAALEGVGTEEQAQLFLDINKNQKPVPPDLVWDLEGEMRPETKDGVISRVAKELNTNGVLQGRIYIPLEGKKKRDQLKLSGMCNAIKKRRLTSRVLEHKVGNPLYEKDASRLVRKVGKNLNSALGIVDSIFDDWQKDGFWYRNSGMAVFMAVFERILCYRKRIPTASDYRKFFGPLRGYIDRYQGRMDDLRKSCSSEAGRDEVAQDFVRAIRRQTNVKNFAPDVGEFEYEDLLVRTERGLASVIAKRLSKETSNWFKERVPEQVRQRILRRKKKDKTAKKGPIESWLNLGEVLDIVNRSDNWRDLEKTFVIVGGFQNREEIGMALITINRLRGRLKHGRAGFDASEDHLIRGYLGKCQTVIRENLG